MPDRPWGLRQIGQVRIEVTDVDRAVAFIATSWVWRSSTPSPGWGHSSPGLTLSIYAHLMPGDQESAVHRLDLLLAGAG